MDIREIIARRISVRTYETEPAPVAQLEAVRLAGERAEALTNAEMRFHLCTDARMGKSVTGIIGDYG